VETCGAKKRDPLTKFIGDGMGLNIQSQTKRRWEREEFATKNQKGGRGTCQAGPGHEVQKCGVRGVAGRGTKRQPSGRFGGDRSKKCEVLDFGWGASCEPAKRGRGRTQTLTWRGKKYKKGQLTTPAQLCRKWKARRRSFNW